ncbi:YbjN domain-containing protein [Saprospira grandis]|uniref:Molecular chaperone Tir n=1 Tax=Saprospira grandis (strain Lewin) TaxID=984262 RepID=H6L2T2_SAPGL|nr:YbjN domain-containing protein [Saprospira grandis]AFC24839.1 hypothetical protein SGRA_2108 [Saprospira grandis str. Lewin]
MSHYKQLKGLIQELDCEILKEIPEEEILIISNEDRGIHQMILDCEDNLLIIEQKLLQLEQLSAQECQELLKANRYLLFGAFVLDESGQQLIYRDTLELENLDLNELEGSINSLTLALVENFELIEQLAKSA